MPVFGRFVQVDGESDPQQVGQALRVEFDHQTGPMQLDRARRDAEFICDKAIWIASRNSSQNGPFALRQSRGFRKSVGLFGGTTGYTLKPAEAAVDRAEQPEAVPAEPARRRRWPSSSPL